MPVNALIDRAAKIVGSKYKLAKLLEVSPNKVNDWAKGRASCSPEDRARIAAFANEDAGQELVRAVLESTEGTTRGRQLEAALGKLLRQTGVVLHTAWAGLIVLGVSQMAEIPRCILRKTAAQNDAR
jgi:hypothetical protein